jgi:hypothetical protein
MSILRAVQLIDENIHFIHSEKKAFMEHLGITDCWKLDSLEFRGAYLTFDYTTTLDTQRKMQVPLFDYASWRRTLRK